MIIIAICVVMVVGYPLLLVIVVLEKLVTPGSVGAGVIFAVATTILYGVAGWFGGIVVPATELGVANQRLARAHRWGGAIAALLLIGGWVADFTVTGRDWKGAPPDIWAAAPLVVAFAVLPHLLLTWRALGTAPQEPIASDTEFLLRLIATLFAIFALAAIEGVLLGNGI
jgi:hypothetical protein